MPPLIFDQYRFKSQFGVSKECIRKLELYENLISKWQEKVNLISKVSAQDLWKRHFFDSAQLLNFIEKTEKVLVDLGSGAGFPGLVLALKFVESGGPRVHLVEANKKKALFLNEANQILNTNAIIHCKRLECIKDLKADIITARALAPLNRLLGQATQFLKPDSTCLFLKGENVSKELCDAQKNWTLRVEKFNSITREGAQILKIMDVKPFV